MNKSKIDVMNLIMKILECLSQKKAATAQEIAKFIDMDESSLNKYLSDMVNAEFISFDTLDQQFTLSTKLFMLVRENERNTLLRLIAHPYLAELSKNLGVTVVLAILENKTDLVILDSVKKNDGLIFDHAYTTKQRSHASAAGMVAFAFNPIECFEMYINKYGLPRLTKTTICEKKEIYKVLDCVRKKGYMIDDCNSVDWVIGWAAPVLDAEKNFVAVVACSSPRTDYYLKNIDNYMIEIVKSANEIADMWSKRVIR